ncbi:uncharacterized protein LOC127454072 isoform X2 [Myxocyprinus asiaticus]|uniref:uncharacterized protein LOC127454072 isoform X2 n=1 Tax=Myxocyprinus asiaticus TaxID=70543 RepID=UPI0022230E82|nr:uncharacterized protein LOC127454072 isoform X2 [Myxocyprinus asiaticus]
MDGTFVISSEKRLQRYLSSLSKCMTGYLVQRMSSCLCRSRTITAYEAQVVTSQATDMQKASKLIQIVIKKGRNACSLFFSCLGFCDPELYESVTGCPDSSHEDHHHSEDIPLSEEQGPHPPCIINIQKSSLTNCIIGNNNNQCITCDQHCWLSQNEKINVDEMEDSQSHDPIIPAQDTLSGNSINVNSSHLEYIIIGDHNSMVVSNSSEVDEYSEIAPNMDG